MPKFIALLAIVLAPVALVVRSTLSAPDVHVVAAAATPTLPSVSLDPKLRANGADPAQARRLADAAAAFTANGLALPDVEVRFFDPAQDTNLHHPDPQISHAETM